MSREGAEPVRVGDMTFHKEGVVACRRMGRGL